MINSNLSKLINELLAQKKIKLVTLLNILNLSKDAVYRRLRGETDFLFSEVLLLSNTFHFSIDALNNTSNADFKTFKTKNFKKLETPEKTMAFYIDSLLTDMKTLNQAGVNQIYYAAKDLPLFCFFASPTLIPFKLFFWYHTIFDANAKRQLYNPKWLPKSIIDNALQIYQLYNQTNSIELWNHETINSTLHQVEFCFDSGIITTKIAIDLLNALEDYIFTIDNNCSRANKEFEDNKTKKIGGSFKMYLNEILLLDNTVIFDIGVQKLIYIPYQTLNFLQSNDEAFVSQNLDWFQKQITKSILISGENQKERSKLINFYTNEINLLKLKIK